MRTHRWPNLLALLVAALAATATATATARNVAAVGDEGLTITPSAVHIGDPVQVSGQFCATGRTVSDVRVWHWYPNTKLPPIEIPVSVSSLVIAQTANGFSFPYVAQEAEVGVGIQVTCDDATVGGSLNERVRVFGPYGRQWFLMPYGVLQAVPGSTVSVVVRSIDCVEGSVATAVLGKHINLPAGSAQTTVTNGVMEFSIDVFKSAVPAVSDLVVECPSVRGGTISDLRGLTILSTGTTIPEVGSPARDWMTAATLLVMCGLVVLTLSDRRRRNLVHR